MAKEVLTHFRINLGSGVKMHWIDVTDGQFPVSSQAQDMHYLHQLKMVPLYSDCHFYQQNTSKQKSYKDRASTSS